jgi:2-polyprenyl-3-methyl-5-hydroxy-6-metoxy-1,4-benzoquinol methylase
MALPWGRILFNTLGYAVARKDDGKFDCPAMPLPSEEVMERARGYFKNCFPLAEGCRLSETEIRERVGEFFWHYPFQFGDISVEADLIHFKGLKGRHYQRYFHFFPPILSRCGGSLASKTVLEIGCNAGFWSFQARLAGADAVTGIDVSEKNVEQAKFIQEITGVDGVDFRQLNAYEVSNATVGEFDVTFFLGLLYHIDKPIEALERLYEITREFAVIDTTLARSDVSTEVPILKLQADDVHDQNFSNRIALVPTRAAVPVMLKHVGFREVYWIQNAGKNLPLDYLTHARMSFIAVK